MLSVDDDAVNQMVAATVLRSHKWGVVKCMNGMEVGDRPRERFAVAVLCFCVLSACVFACLRGFVCVCGRVLVSTRTQIARTLKRTRTHTFNTHPNRQALDHLGRCAALPDLVLLDVMMPQMSGYDVARRIRQMYPSSTLPVIMVRDSGGGAGW